MSYLIGFAIGFLLCLCIAVAVFHACKWEDDD